MSKIFLLVIFLPFFSFANYYPATIYLNDGTLKTGLIEPPYAEDKAINFKTTENNKKEKIKIEDVKGFDFTNKDGVLVKYITLKLARVGFFNHDKLKVDDRKSWVEIWKQGKISIYIGYYRVPGGYGASSGISYSGGTSALSYIQRENEDFALYLEAYYGGANIVMNAYSNLKKEIAVYFKNCPKLGEVFTKDVYKEKGTVYLVDLYEQNCK